MTVAKKAAISAVGVSTTDKVFNHAGTTSDYMPKKPEHAAAVPTRVPSTRVVKDIADKIKKGSAAKTPKKEKTLVLPRFIIGETEVEVEVESDLIYNNIKLS